MKKFEHQVPCSTCGGVGHVTAIDHAALRGVRKLAFIGLREMARRAGVSAAYICDIEFGRRRATPKIVKIYERETRR